MSDQTDINRDTRRGPRSSDRRVQRTKAALRTAFNHLILTKGYDGFSTADVAEAADVGRSTFYEHYRSKEDILAESILPVLTPLADCCGAPRDGASLVWVIQHFWDNRKLARALMCGRSRDVMTRQLARLIEARLVEERLTSNGLQTLKSADTILPASLAAVQLAAGQLALIAEWLLGRHGCTADQIAAGIKTNCRLAISSAN